jgi:hypothetical protein
VSGGAPKFKGSLGGDGFEVCDATNAVGAEEFTGEVCRRGHAEMKGVRKAKCVWLGEVQRMSMRDGEKEAGREAGKN